MPPVTSQTRTECLGTDTKGQQEVRSCFQIHLLSSVSPIPFPQYLRTVGSPPRKTGPVQSEQFSAPLGWAPSSASICLPISHPAHLPTHPPMHASCFHLHCQLTPAALHHVHPSIYAQLRVHPHLLPVFPSSTSFPSPMIPSQSPVILSLSIHPTSCLPPPSTLTYFTHPSSAHPPTHLCA